MPPWIFHTAFSVIVCYLVFWCYQFVVFRLWCSDDIARCHLESLCENFKNKTVGGSWCPSVCITKEIEFRRCLKTDIGKIAFTAECRKPVCDEFRNMKIVIKYNNKRYKVTNSTDQNTSNSPLYKFLESEFPKAWFDKQGDWTYQGTKHLLELVNREAHVVGSKETLSIILAQETLEGLSSEEKYLHFRDKVSLLAQGEFFFSELYRESWFVPTFFGTCGPYYAVEETNPIDFSQSWNDRLKVAINLLRMIEAFEEESLHLCDFRKDNFGMSKGQYGVVKLIDSDMIWDETVLLKEFSQTFCTKTSKCNVYDCQGVCNTKTEKCMPKRKNSNLQVLCEHMFLPNSDGKGLLYDPPENIREDLSRLLSQCSKLSESYDNTYLERQQIRLGLYKLLHKAKT